MIQGQGHIYLTAGDWRNHVENSGPGEVQSASYDVSRRRTQVVEIAVESGVGYKGSSCFVGRF